jgi:hypothetical protein
MIIEQILASCRLSFVLPALCLTVSAAGAQTPQPTEWQMTKCRVYSQALERLKRDGIEGLSASFLDENAAFIGTGCMQRTPVCPRTPADLDAANILTIATMNAGAASTFLPFDCVRP